MKSTAAPCPRLRRAGCERDLFTSGALGLLHQFASSSLREIDHLATAALREAARRTKKLVERDVPARVAGEPPPPTADHLPGRRRRQ